jgi:hypothetical protein
VRKEMVLLRAAFLPPDLDHHHRLCRHSRQLNFRKEKVLLRAAFLLLHFDLHHLPGSPYRQFRVRKR